MAVIRKLKNHDGQEFHPTVKYIEKKNHGGHDESNWLISYADMMTLLCVFFILLFSMAKMNAEQVEAAKKNVVEKLGGHYTSPTEDLGKFINNVLVETGVQKDATMTSDGESVSIAFHSTLFFDSLSAEISPAGKEIMNKIIAGINEKQKANGKMFKMVVEGHTDSQPVVGGAFPSNWELSSSRATRVIRLFLDQNFKPENLLAIGYADTQPVAESRNPDGSWNMENLGKNRRVVLRVLLPEVDSIPWKMKTTPSADSKTNAPVNGVLQPVPASSVVAGVTAPVMSPVTSSAPAVAVVPATSTAPTQVTIAPIVPAKVQTPSVAAQVTVVPTSVTAPAAALPQVTLPVVPAIKGPAPASSLPQPIEKK